MLMLVLFHGFMGVRTVVDDYTRGGAADGADDGLYLLGARPLRDGHDRRHDRCQIPAG